MGATISLWGCVAMALPGVVGLVMLVHGAATRRRSK
jgi:hypothetical protein